MIKKYLASGRSSIKEVEYDRETKSFLYCGDVRTAKETNYSKHFDTHAEAYQWLVDRVYDEIRALKVDVQLWERVLELIVDKHADNFEEEYALGMYAFHASKESDAV